MIDFVSALSVGLTDPDYDIRMLVHLIFGKLANLAPASILPVLDQLVAPLTETLNTTPKRNAVQQDEDRVNELIRSAVKACRLINTIPGAETSTGFQDIINKVIAGKPQLKEFYDAGDVESPSTPATNEGTSGSVFR